MMRDLSLFRRGGISLTLALILTSQAHAESLSVPKHMAVASNEAFTAASVQAALRYAAFWNSGDEQLARTALAGDFVDRTLPTGRPQGISGPLQASSQFRQAVPDLSAEVDDIVAAGDRVSVHLHFHGHFTGQFGSVQGKGQPLDFQAFDLYRVENGKIKENWHLEDNLSLMQQLGVIKP